MRLWECVPMDRDALLCRGAATVVLGGGARKAGPGGPSTQPRSGAQPPHGACGGSVERLFCVPGGHGLEARATSSDAVDTEILRLRSG
jgi:hypothetical protein